MKQSIIFVVLLTMIGLSACSKESPHTLRFYADGNFLGEYCVSSDNLIAELKKSPKNHKVTRWANNNYLINMNEGFILPTLPYLGFSAQDVMGLDSIIEIRLTPSETSDGVTLFKQTTEKIWQKPKSESTFGDSKIAEEDLQELQRIIKK